MAPDKYHHIVNTLNNLPLLPNIGVSLSVGAVLLIGAANILLQATTPAADISWAEHLTLEGALIAAVVVLWKALGSKDVQIALKDAQLVKSTEAVTMALAASAASNVELRKIIEHLNESLSQARL